jgi:Ricin-type beta-trefoil lectin domain
MHTSRSAATTAPFLVRLAALTLSGLALALTLVVGASPAHAATKRALPATAQASGPAGLPYITTFQSLATGYALDSNFAGSVYGLGRNGGNYQKWYVSASDYGTVTLRNVATWRCLDSNTSRQVYTLGCNGGSFQKWIVLQRDYGTVVLRNLATGFVLDGDAARRIYTNPENGGSYQKWVPIAA